LMVERARAGNEVVRLKGGDPFVFGRGGEEALALRAAGIDYEIVPGITAGVAALAYAGIPVTHRGISSAVALIAGHEDPDKEAGPGPASADSPSWLPPRPLAGRIVAVTRARDQASSLAHRLEALGARVVQAPTIRVRALPGPPLDPAPYDLVCVTSANGVQGL